MWPTETLITQWDQLSAYKTVKTAEVNNERGNYQASRNQLYN